MVHVSDKNFKALVALGKNSLVLCRAPNELKVEEEAESCFLGT